VLEQFPRRKKIETSSAASRNARGKKDELFLFFSLLDGAEASRGLDFGDFFFLIFFSSLSTLVDSSIKKTLAPRRRASLVSS
jgi:hypothetical protein